ncbi:septal ring lytic transglycosylase RlpA family protein, partial [Acidithiobacillus sp.]|uniref:septal ring lytic transglycosylase RlpA family protein n=1 Tax=Acidithiobacillus sp. TaxID=1872118 RepID=UPI003D092631
MAVSCARRTVYTVLGLWALALSGCAGVSTSPTPSSASPSASATCATPAPDLRAAYNRPYQVHGRIYAPLNSSAGYAVRGMASWYGWESGSTTAMGTPFRPRAFSAASRDLPLPTCARVTNLSNG